MGFQLIRLGRLITTFRIHQFRGLIKPGLAIKKQHQLVMMMSKQFRAHLSKFRVLLLIRCSIIWIVSAACAIAGRASSQLDD